MRARRAAWGSRTRARGSRACTAMQRACKCTPQRKEARRRSSGCRGAMPNPLRVVIVDDELLARQRIEDLLAKEENVVVAGTASDGTSAIDAIRELHPDLVFLDVQMPGKSGLEVVNE